MEGGHVGSRWKSEDGSLPQPCDCFRSEFLPPTAPSTPGACRPQPRACPRLTKGNQICCSCSGREQALPETGKQLERDACQPGGVNIYTTWCVGRGQAEGGGRNQAALRLQVEGACALASGGKGKRWLGSSSPPEFLHHSGQSLLPAGSWQS